MAAQLRDTGSASDDRLPARMAIDDPVLVGECRLVRAVGVHHVDLAVERVVVAIGGEQDLRAVGRPPRREVDTRRPRVERARSGRAPSRRRARTRSSRTRARR